MTRLRMAVVGVGHLGKEHARILAGLPEVELVGVADAHAPQAQAVAQKLGVQAYSHYWPLVNLVDAVCVVVPTNMHAVVGDAFLRSGIPVLIEKPMTETLAEADQLLAISETTETIVQVGHIERFNPAYQALKNRPLVPKFIQAERMGPFTGRASDVGVVLDLMIHDLDLILDLVQSPVDRVEALGVSVFGRNEDIANARLHFSNGCIAELTASRAHHAPSRQMRVWGAEGFAHLDFAARKTTLVQPSQEVRRHGLDPMKLDAASRSRIREELFDRYLESAVVDGQGQDQLTAELKHFVHCVQNNEQPAVDAKAGRRALALAEQVRQGLNQHPWNATHGSPKGPLHMPAAVGNLFPPKEKREAA